MGVLGLTPFLQKTCPEVIRKLPHRLRDLSGQTIVIDGTLITQRLHFAPMPHPYRHVLGWYRLVKELRDNNIRSICVFDGKERSLAKASEIERRRHVRKIDAMRGMIESDRLQRLDSVAQLLKTCRTLGGSERQQATETLKAALANAKADPSASAPLYLAGDLASLDSQPDPLPIPTIPLTITEQDFVDELDESDVQEILLRDLGEPIPVTETSLVPDVDHSTPTFGLPRHEHDSEFRGPEDLPFDQLSLDSYNIVQPALPDESLVDKLSAAESPRVQDLITDNATEKIPSSLAALYLNYRQSVSKLDILSAPTLSAIHQSATSPTADDAADLRTEFAMSKSQYQLMLDEGRFWENLIESVAVDEDNLTAEESLAVIAEKSHIITQSYQRRSNPPTDETYAESKEILRAMGVPCIESTGPFEAEALASSLVLHGLADYVASEDTDVLVYGAPMIRNITSRKEPLAIISGSEVRAVLNLDQASYIDFALLLGTDFSQRIKNLGPHRALKFIREHGSIENILAREKQFSPRQSADTYLEQVQTARMVFTTLPPVPDLLLLQPMEYNEKEITDILHRYRLQRLAIHDGWDCSVALEGNYFQDNPMAA